MSQEKKVFIELGWGMFQGFGDTQAAVNGEGRRATSNMVHFEIHGSILTDGQVDTLASSIKTNYFINW